MLLLVAIYLIEEENMIEKNRMHRGCDLGWVGFPHEAFAVYSNATQG